MASSLTSQIPYVAIQEVFNITAELKSSCKDVYHQLDKMRPQEQVECINAIGLSTISKHLNTIKNFISSIQFNQRCVTQITYLYDSINEIFENQSYNPEKVNELQHIVDQLISRPRINEGNQLALQTIKETLDAIEESDALSVVIDSSELQEESESGSNSETDSNSSKSVSQEMQTPIDSPKQTEESDPDDPFLITEEITNLIMQMQTSSEISPDDKKELTKAILALLNESPAIEPIPLQPSVNPPAIIHEVEKKIDAIQELRNLLLLFQNSSSGEHKDHLLALESKKVKLPIIGNPSVDVAGRIYFHLYFIHKEKSQGKLPKDLDYGKNAMRGIYPTTHDERIRAIARAIVEFTLPQLEDAVNANQFEDVRVALSALEELKMSPNDMPKEQPNLAHALFGKMYNKHAEARKNKPTLVDPRDWKFRGDFGRKAFSMSDGIDVGDKIAVIRDLLQELKKVWQVP